METFQIENKITGTLFEGADDTKIIFFAGGTGIKQTYYSKFLDYLCNKTGYSVVSFDYQSIGQSKFKPVHKYDIDFYFWRHDIELVLEYVRNRFKDRKIIYLAHSYGGQFFGTLQETSGVEKLIFIASQNAYWKNYAKPHKYWLFWKFMVPVISLFSKHFPAKKIGMGEDMPKGVVMMWRKWCLLENYFFDDPYVDTSEFSKVKIPLTCYAMIDDEWGNVEAVKFIKNKYNNSPGETIVVDPKKYNLNKIGHNGFFRKEVLWNLITERINKSISLAN